MKKRILILEDLPEDIILIKYELKAAAIDAEITAVTNKSEYKTAFKSKSYDLILSDFNVPGFKELEQFTLAQKYLPDIPFLFVTGVLGDEHIVELLKLGVADVVMKDNLSRLAMSVLRAITEAEARKERIALEIKLSNSEAKYKALFEYAGDAIFLMKDFTFVECNDRTLELFGCQRNHIIGKHPADFSPVMQPDGKNSKTESEKKMQQAMALKNLQFEWVHQKLNGDLFDAEISLTAVQISNEFFLQAIVRDISESKEFRISLEKSRQMLADAQSLAHIGSFEWFVNENEAIWSDELYNIFGVDKRIDIDLETYYSCIHPEDLGHLQKTIGEAIEYGNGYKIDHRVIRPDGKIVYVHCEAEVELGESGQPHKIFGVTLDITSHKLAEKRLLESELKFRSLVENIEDVIMLTNAEGVINFITGNIENVIGYKPEECLGKMAGLFIHPEDREQVCNKRIEISLNPGKTEESQHRLIHKNGEVVWIEGIASNLLNIKQVGAIVTSFRDITSRNEQKQKLLIATTALEEADNGVLITNVKGEIRYVNNSMEKLTGYSKAEMLGRTPRLFKSGYHNSMYYKKMWTTLLKGGTWKGEFVNKRKSGEVYTEEQTITPVRADGEEITHFISVRQNISVRKQYESDLIEARERFFMALEGGNLGVWDWNVELGTLTHDDRWSEILGYLPNEISSDFHSWRNLVHPDDMEITITLLQDHLDNKTEYYDAEYRMLLKNGEWKWIRDRGKVFQRNKKGKPLRVTGTIQDISEQKEALDSMQKMTGELLKTNAELEQFAYITSHNLRAPVANMIGLLALQDGIQNDPELHAQILGKIRTSIFQLNETLADLIDVVSLNSDIEERKELLEFEVLFNAVKQGIERLIIQSHAQFAIDFSAAPKIHYYRAHLHSVILNLVSNSIKYRFPDRPLKIEINTKRENGYVILSVKDNGIGMDIEKVSDRIFKMFQRFNEKAEGKGLGLYIIKSQVEKMGGKIEVESVLGEGTTFHVYLKDQAVK